METEAEQLKAAIDHDDVVNVRALMLTNPALHGAPLGYANDGPLTWVAECRLPGSAPSPARLLMAEWMIQNGSDVHQGGDGPLMRAALHGERIPMMDLLLANGADVNAAWHGHFPIVFAPCETLDADSLNWLLQHGSDPNCGRQELWQLRGVAHPGTALDYLLQGYLREPEALNVCIGLLLDAGGKSKYQDPAVLAIVRGHVNELEDLLTADPALPHWRFASLDFGASGARMLTLKGATLLHVAAEFGNLEAAKLLIEHGADVNACASLDEAGVGGQTAIFHAATQAGDMGLSMVRLLVDRGSDLNRRSKLPGHYEAPGEILECNVLEYALLFPGNGGPTSTFLRERMG